MMKYFTTSKKLKEIQKQEFKKINLKSLKTIAKILRVLIG